MQIRHDAAGQRFIAQVDGLEAVLEYRELGEQLLDFRRTFTPPSLRQRGIGRALVLYALEHARRDGSKVVPSCPFVAKLIRENPQYHELTTGISRR